MGIKSWMDRNNLLVQIDSPNGNKTAMMTSSPISVDGNSAVMATQKLEFLKLGRLYYIQKVFTGITDGSNLDISLDSRLVVPDFPNGFLGKVIIYPFKIKTSEGQVIATLYGGGDYSGGTPITMINRNELSSNTHLSVVREMPTINTLGIAGAQYIVGTQDTNQFPGGGESRDDDPLIANTAVQKMLRIANNTGKTISIDFRILIAEF